MVTVSCLILLGKVLIHHYCDNFLSKGKQLLDHPVASHLSARLSKTSPLMCPSDIYCRFLNIFLFFHMIPSSFCFSSAGVLLLLPLQPHCQWLKDDNHSPAVQTTALPKPYSLWFVLFIMRAHCWFIFSLVSTNPPLNTNTSSSTQPIDL